MLPAVYRIEDKQQATVFKRLLQYHFHRID